ncbi:hypothetical protein BSL78_20001 [Apostichopus japonicus]|uniref:Ig-like domain-containing protein n=1 Tax=Stichopus japonicus TaxID=307972 RepID=A0A2G8K5D0_STIJA|nr:hypothetical protein BSL78_20001 [Apostichopus japonicus]
MKPKRELYIVSCINIYHETHFTKRKYHGEQGGSACNSPQYLEFGRPGTVSCAFVDQFFGVYWYNSTEVSDESRPIIYYTNSQKDGEGYLSGEFDVFPNGSLVITNVSLQHEHVFTVIMFKAITEAPVTINVSVFAIVKPRQKFPTINICGDKRVCFWKIDQPVMMFCYVNDSRPAVNLTLVTRTVYGDEQLMATPLLQQQNHLHTSTVVMNLPIRAFVTLYVCTVNEPPVLMENNETAILVQSSNGFNSTEVKPVQMFAEKGENVNINCSCSSYNSTLYVIWIRQETEVVAHNIAYNVMWQGYWINETNDRYYITNYSNLVIPDITVKDDGIYACVTGNGIREKVTTVNITVYVQPNPQYLTVDGCIAQQNCLLSVKRTGTLTCRLHRIRPIVSLQWRFVDESSQNKFQKGILTVTEASEGSTYDITFSSEYSTEDDSSDTIQVECFVDENVDLPLDWSTWSKRLDLLVPQVIEMSTIEKLLSTTLGKLLFSLSLVFPFTIAVIVAISFSCKKSMAWKKINFTDIVDDDFRQLFIQRYDNRWLFYTANKNIVETNIHRTYSVSSSMDNTNISKPFPSNIHQLNNN